MTVEIETSIIAYTGNATTTVFSVPFYFLANDELVVELGGVVQTLTTHYSLTGAGVLTGGTVTMVTAPASGIELVIYRDPSFKQPIDFVDGDPLPEESIEKGFDRGTMRDQWLRENVERSVRLAIGDTSDASMILPTPVASKLLGVNAAGDGLALYSADELVAVTVSARSEWLDDDGDSDGVAAIYTNQSAPGYEIAVEDTDLTALFHKGRRIKVSGTLTGTVYADIVTSDFNSTIADDTYIRIKNIRSAAGAAGTISNESLLIWAGIISSIGTSIPGVQITPQMLGAKGDGVTDDTAAFESFAAIAGDKHIPSGTYIVSKQIDFTLEDRVTFGIVTLDFSGATVSGDFPDDSCIHVDGGALTAIPDLSGNVSDGDEDLVFTSAPDVDEGDVIIIYDPTDSSFNGAKTTYRAGEFCRVESLSSLTVRIYGGTYAAYVAATVDCYKLSGNSASWSGGRLFIKTPDTLNNVYSFHAERLVDSHFDNIAGANSGYAALRLHQCFNVSCDGVILRQHEDAGNATDYGLLVSNCQEIRASGEFYGRRHGVALGGGGVAGDVPCREILCRGHFASDSTTGGAYAAVNAHGNCEHYQFEGTYRGTLQPGGDFGTFKGQVFIPNARNGIAVYFTDMLGWNFDLSGLQIRAHGDPATVTRGVVDLGGNADGASASTTRGGTLNLRAITLEAPDALLLVKIINRGSAPSEPIIVDLTGFSAWKTNGSLVTGINFNVVSGNNFDRIKVGDIEMDNDPAWSLTGVDAVAGWRQSGTLDVDTTTGISTITGAVTFNKQAPKPPHVLCGTNANTISGNVPMAGPETIGVTGFTARLRTYDNANFGAAVTREMYWVAELEE